jgi:hypothetical protein
MTVAAPATNVSSGQTLLLSLPKPTGPYPVGVRADSVSDPSRIDETTGRPRRLPIHVWYPARQHSHAPSAPYLSPLVRAWAEDKLGLSGLFEIDTHASADARARRHVRGVLVVQPGGGSLPAFQTGLIIDLASRGYAIVAMEHPHESVVVEEPDGTLIEGDPDSFARPFQERILDAAVVLADLRRLVPEARRHTPVGMFGHSRGGAATAEVMFHFPQVSAGVALDIGTILFGDPGPPGDVVQGGLDQPFGLMCSLDQPCDSPLLVDFISRLRGPHPTETLEILHNGYTDFVVFNPEAARTEPAVAALLDAIWPTGTVDSLPAGRRAFAAQRRFLAEFFGRYLKEGR